MKKETIQEVSGEHGRQETASNADAQKERIVAAATVYVETSAEIPKTPLPG